MPSPSAAQDIECLPECRPAMILVELRPEQGEECVSGLKACRVGCGQVSQQGEPFGLRQYRAELIAFGTAKINRAQQR